MPFRYLLPLLMAVTLIAGCAGNAIAPQYATDNPDIMRIGNERPADSEVEVESLGSYCVEVRNTWNEHGKTPDGQTLWAKDTYRKVVPCS